MSGPAETPSGIVLSVCVRCKDGREDAHGEERGGARLARAVAEAIAARQGTLPPIEGRRVRCMSQCKRPCTVALSAPGAFTYLFGDLDPDRHAGEVLDLLRLYAVSPDGFMPRDARPEPIRAGILGRIPPLGRPHELVEPLLPQPAHLPETDR